MPKTKRKARPRERTQTRDGRERYTTVLHPEARALLEAESMRRFKTERRANLIIEELAREHLQVKR